LKQPTRKALHIAAQLGCDGVQFDARQEIRPTEISATGLRHLRKLLNDLNLRVASIALPSPFGYAQPDGLQHRVDATREAMRLASQLQARVLVFNLGPVPDPPIDRGETATDGHEDQLQNLRSRGWSTLVDALGVLASHGNRLGVQLAAYAPGTDPHILLQLVSELPEGALGVDLSPAPLVAAQGSVINFVEILGPHIVHVYGSDAVRDPASQQAVEVELGRGSADYPELLGHLEEFGYRGWITLVRQYSNRQLEDLDNAVRYLQAI